MPKAIISPKNNPKSKINIYDFIPTIKNENISQPTTNYNNNIQQQPVNLPVNTLTKPQLKQNFAPTGDLITITSSTPLVMCIKFVFVCI